MKKIILYFSLFVSSFGFSQNHLVSVLHEDWINDAWTETGKDIYIYEAQNDLLVFKNSQLKIGSEWKNVSSIQYSYRPQDFQISAKFWSEWSDLTNDFEPKFGAFYGYTNNVVSGFTMKKWNPVSEDWDPLEAESYAYNPVSGLMETYYYMVWSPGWIQTVKKDHTYNADNLLSQSDESVWTNNTFWKLDHRYNYTYTSFDRVETFKQQEYENMEWKDSLRETNTYNNADSISNKLMETWDDLFEEWNKTAQIDYSYNPGNRIHQTVSQDWIANGGFWVNDHRITYTYGTPYFFGLEENESTSFKIYPNPANEAFHIDFSKETRSIISVLDVQGKILYNDLFEGMNHQISLEKIPAGVYLVKVESDGKVEVKKMIVK